MEKFYTPIFDAMHSNLKKIKRNSSHLLLKAFCALLLAIGVSGNSWAQVSSYTFSQTTGAYSALVGNTTAVGGAAMNDDNLYSTTGLPFAFTFNGTAYPAATAIGISANGFIRIGAAAVNSYTSISDASNFNVVAAFNRDLQEQRYATTTGTWALGSTTMTVVSAANWAVGMKINGTTVGLTPTGIPAGTIVTNIAGNTITMSQAATAAGTNVVVGPASSLTLWITGTAPNRSIVFQWTNYKRYGALTPQDNYSFQIWLNEGGGVATNQTVQVRYGNCTSTSTTAITPMVGLKGAAATDFNSRQMGTWAASIATTANTGTMTHSNTSSPTSGTIYIWTPPTPPACAQPTTLTSSAITSTSATISWTAPASAPASGYQYFVSTVNTAPTGATVPTGSTAAGVTSANLTGLTANTTYYFWVRSNCGGSGTSTWSAGSFYTGYCAVGGTTGTYYISNFTTNGGLTNINNTSAYTVGGYTNYTAQSMSATAGQSVGFTISFGGGGTEGVRIYIDWNNDLDFLDANENPTVASAAYVASGWASTFTVPVGTANGNYRMRVVADYLSTTPISCGSSAYLEAEDYTLSVVTLASCTGTPTAGTAVTSATAISCSGTTNLSVTGSSTGSGLTYQWQQSFNGGAYTNIAGATAATYTTATLSTAGTYVFKRIITCTASGLSATSAASATLTLTYSAVACLAYCTPSQSSGCSFDYISNVTFSTINRSSTCDGASTTLTVYPTPNPTITQGSSYAISVSTGGDAEGAGVWIDWNQNGVFDVATEQILSSYAGTNPATYTATVTVPVTAIVGSTRMRVRCNYFGVSSPCTAQTYGECEDYYITIAAAAPCSGTPTPGNTLTSSASVAVGGTVNLTLSTPPTGTGLTYAWQSGPSNTGPWTTIATTGTYTATVSATTWYRCIVTCAGVTGTSAPVQVTAVVANNIPFSGSSSVACGTSTLIYDHGGSAGDYLNNANGYIVLNNASGSTAVISLTGTYNTEGNYDYLRIYDGTGTGGTLLASYSGLSGTITPFTSAAGQTITVQFQSDVSSVYSGIALNAVYSGSCAVPACSGTPAPGNTLTSSGSVASGSTVNLSLSTPPTGSGLTYAWQSGPSNTGPWTTIATTATYTATVTAMTWYRCLVTCSGNTGTATPVQVTLTACIPTSTYGCTSGDVIARVILNTLDNNSGPGCPSGVAGYSNYTTNPALTTTLMPSSSYNCIVYAGAWAGDYAAWIDYNDNLVFELSERIGYTTSTIAANTSASFAVVLSCTPPAGQHLMRVREAYATAGSAIDPCAVYLWGEIEDYMITISAPPACASPGLMTTLTPAANSATLTWATSCSSATSYDFQYGPAGFALGTGTMLTNQAVTISAPNASFNLTGLTGGTAYTVYYRANCGGGLTSAWSIANNFSTLAVWKDAWVSMNTGAAVWCPGETRVVTVTVTNTGNMTWTNATPDINIGVKWNAEADYFVRTDANGLAPGATQTYSLSMTAPLVLGTNNLTFDLVSENNFWFASNANGAGPSNVIYTSATITISSPTVSAGSAMAAICQGTASAALGGSFGGTATSAVWSGGAGTFTNNTGSTPGTATYTASASETGTITLTLTTSGGPCGTVFATKTIVVNANLPASVSIAASATTICDGTSVTFTATPTNGGAAPAYQWKVNGTNVGTNSATYTNAALANGNVVTCVLTSNATPCSTGSPATSNSITMVVNPNLPASISIAASATSICIGTSVTFTATPTNGGTTPAYQWKVNGANVGTGASTYASTTLANNDLVTCVLTSNASPCLTGSPATSNAVTITVNALPTVTANVTSTPICLGSTTTLTGGGASTYSWDNGASNAVSFAPAATTTYTVTGTSAAGCTNTASVLVTVNTPTVTAPVVAGTVVWHGATSVDFGTSSNWLAYNGTSYAVSASAPTASTNVIIPVTQGCVTQQPSVVLSGTVAANDVVIESGATLSMGSGTLNIHGNYTNNGTLVGGTGTVAFVGASGDQTITKTGGETITSMTVNKAAGNVILNNNVTVTGGLSLTSGLVVLGTNDLIMSGGGISNASAASYVKTSDTGVFKHNVGSSVFNFPIGNGAYNPIDLTNSGTSDLFSVRVIDGAPGTPNNAINRKWMVERAGTANVNVTMRLYWNGVGDESSAFTTSTGAMFIDHLTGGSWFNEGGTSNTASALNYVEKAGITSFSPFTVSRFATPLPVELMSLDAQCAGENVVVSWKTASEHNSLNFVVERSDDGTAWTEIQTVGAAGNSNTIIEYAIEDAGAARGVNYYRLIQVDQDGVQKIYGPILSNCGSDVNMFMSFPNPSDAEITLVFTDKNINGSTTLMVRDAHGRVVRSIALEIQPGTTSILIPDMELEPAVYYLQLVGDNFTSPVIKHSLR